MKKVELNFPEQEDSYFLREAYKTARANFMFSGEDVKAVVVTSCHMSEGKTTVSVTLARSLAEFGKRVILLDADLRKSAMAGRFGVMIDKGFSHYLSGQAEWDDVLCQTQIEGFDIVFAGQIPPNPVELVGSRAMKELIERLRKEYDYILIDSPPLGMVIDSAVIAPYADGALLVLDAGRVQTREAQYVKAQLEKSKCRILGVILNHTERKMSLIDKIRALFKKKAATK